MRWAIKIYPTPKSKFNTQNFNNTKMHFFDYNGWNILVYGEDAHEFFYDKYNNEEYHEFCNVIPKYGY